MDTFFICLFPFQAEGGDDMLTKVKSWVRWATEGEPITVIEGESWARWLPKVSCGGISWPNTTVTRRRKLLPVGETRRRRVDQATESGD